ncbi:TetR/AcrR family transcriptional regulator [Nocardia stercoris]|uniref:TetR/AcrR family transcriptional regulator n=2 Tax=Nocardia stercoris TaxID=2483361 RepID=A0A3M2L574_9NOCA|nr:TetR/AcrR family transcriptional regulator [Nocardia stercoris]
MARIVDATIESITEVGYGRTTIREICRRAEVSQGALLRHFPTRHDVIIAAAEEVSHRHAQGFAAKLAAVPAGADPIAAALVAVREGTRGPLNTVWHELVVAARTTPELADKLRPLMRHAYELTGELAATVPGYEALPPEVRQTLVTSVVHLFNGEALSRAIYPMPEIEEQRLRLLTGMLGAITGKPAS